jgi:hypothetical protein
MGTFDCGSGDEICVLVGRIVVVWCENARVEGGLGARGGSLSDAVCGGEGGLDVVLAVGRVVKHRIYPKGGSKLSFHCVKRERLVPELRAESWVSSGI